MGYDRFLVIRTNEHKKVSDLCIFNIFDEIVGCCDDHDSFVMIQVGTPNQISLLKNLNMIFGNPVSCTSLDTLNYTREVIYCREEETVRKVIQARSRQVGKN